MKVCFFHLMPYRFLPDNFENGYRSVWVDVSSALYDSGKTHGLYHEFLDELEHAERCGFDGLCVNEHHQNAYTGLRKRLHRVAAPALILWGDEDRVNPVAYGDEFEKLIRQASLRRLPGGHMLHLETPDAVAAAVTGFCDGG